MRARPHAESGFTLIEMLVVIVIISILAAIAIPLFVSQREKAWASQVESTLKNAATSMESWGTSHNGNFTAVTVPILEDEEGLKYAAESVTLTIPRKEDGSFCLAASHVNLATPFFYDSEAGRPQPGACPP